MVYPTCRSTYCTLQRLLHFPALQREVRELQHSRAAWLFLPRLEHAGSTCSEQGAPPGHSSHLCCRPCAGCPGPCAAGPGRIDTMTCPGLSGLASHALRCPPHILTVSVRCLPKHRGLPLVQGRCMASSRNGGRFLHRSLQMEIRPQTSPVCSGTGLWSQSLPFHSYDFDRG